MKIKSIKKIDANYQRYDIQTKNHNFFANGILVHNSLIKIVRIGNNLLWSTNGTIDAFKAPLAEQIGCLAKSFGELAWLAIVENWRAANGHDRNVCIDPDVVNGWLRNLLEEGHTYMFELTSPYNKVVVSWHETKLNFLGVRDNSTLQETYFSDHALNKIFNVPKVFPLKSIDDCVKLQRSSTATMKDLLSVTRTSTVSR